MSTRFTIICDTCDDIGPHIRRHHSGAFLQEDDAPRFFYGSDEDEASRDWGGFLIEHEYHQLRLATEWRPGKEPEPIPGPTHRLLSDGSIEPL